MTQTESPQSEQRLQQWLNEIDAQQLVTLFGFTSYLVWEFMCAYEMVPFLAPFFAEDQLHLLRSCLFGVLALCFIGALIFAPRLKRAFLSFLCIGGIFGFLTLAITFLGLLTGSIPFWLGVIAWSFFGVSVASLMLMWALVFSQNHPRSNPTFIAGSYIMAMIIFLLLSLTSPSQQTYLLVGLLLIIGSIATALFLGQKLVPAKQITYAQQKTKSSLVQLLHAGAYGIIYGFALSFLLTFGPLSAPIGAAGALLGCGLTIIMIKKGTLLNSIHLRRSSFAPVVIAVLFLPFGGTWGSLACSLLIIAACVCTAIASWIVVSREVAENSLNPARAFAQNKMPGWIGFFIGSLLGGILMSTAPEWFPLVTSALAALICLAFSAFELNLHEPTNSPSESTIPASEINRRFQAKCDLVSSGCGLSPREDEVFRLLAKGRNAEHISQVLCIAKPTVKTHIQHVYQKTGINSHQELIDLIELNKEFQNHPTKPVL